MRTLALSAAAARFVARGGRDVASDKLNATPPLVAGEHVRLVDELDEELGLAIADLDNGLLRVLATPRDGFARIDGALVGLRVERALAWRAQLGLGGDDEAYRLVHHAGDGLPGLACDVLGRVAVIYAYGSSLRPLARTLADAVIGFAKLDGAVVKLRARRRGDDDADGAIDLDVVGSVPPRLMVNEYDTVYEVHPLGALNTGLFTDMREHRRGLHRFARGRRVLNLFSYTGSLSLACARGGATSVTSVDTSDGVHAWARGNFTHAGCVDDSRWQFHAGDAVRFLARAIRDRERYDLVIIDPPTFSTARGQPWSLTRDYAALIAQAAAVLSPDGVLWLAANSHELAQGVLAKLAAEGVLAADRGASIVEQGGLPPEYPTVAVQVSDRYLQVCVLRVA
jgi:23S rRNA (cytosine1962-C5)-methyltransferase